MGAWESENTKTRKFTTTVSGSYAPNGIFAIANLTKGDMVSQSCIFQQKIARGVDLATLMILIAAGECESTSVHKCWGRQMEQYVRSLEGGELPGCSQDETNEVKSIDQRNVIRVYTAGMGFAYRHRGSPK